MRHPCSGPGGIGDGGGTQRNVAKAFRAPLPESTSIFKGSFQATYGDTQKVAGIRGSTVTAADGSKMDIKRIKVVPADSSTARDEQQVGRG